MAKQLNSAENVMEALSDVYAGLKDGSLKPNVACEMNNACGKIIGVVKLQLEYYALIKDTPHLAFLESSKPEMTDPALLGANQAQAPGVFAAGQANQANRFQKLG